MERKSDYDNDGLDPSEEYFRKRKKVMMRMPISHQKNPNHLIIKNIKK
tara:strand:+ start:431 stop:574 length:144 start_codon:yes stop_codon:yes gene_type:complete